MLSAPFLSFSYFPLFFSFFCFVFTYFMPFKDQQLIIRVTPFTDSGRTLVFPVIECTLEEDHIIKVGRYASNKRDSCYFWPFRSKVVSRHHAEICTKQGRVSFMILKGSFIKLNRSTSEIPDLLQELF